MALLRGGRGLGHGPRFCVFRLRRCWVCVIVALVQTDQSMNQLEGVASVDEKRTIRRLSYSSAAQYSDCAERWRLSRVYGLDKATYWVTLMGTAVHEVTEALDLNEVGLASDKHAPLLDVDPGKAFTVAFDREKARRLGEGTTINASGRVLKTGLGKGGGPNRKDEEWARHYGPIMVQNWIDWRSKNNYKIALFDTADGNTAPGIELKVSHPLGGYPNQPTQTHDSNASRHTSRH